MKNKEVKARRITHPGLLKLNWMEEFTGEQEAQTEPDVLPPQPEDAVVFFNSCTITQVGKTLAVTLPCMYRKSSLFECYVHTTARQIQGLVMKKYYGFMLKILTWRSEWVTNVHPCRWRFGVSHGPTRISQPLSLRALLGRRQWLTLHLHRAGVSLL